MNVIGGEQNMSLQDKMNVSAKPALKSLKTEVANELGISKPYAYKLLREMNEELKQKGFINKWTKET